MPITSQNPSASAATQNRQRLLELFRSSPIPNDELLVNLGLYMRSGALARILFFDELYRKIVGIPGCVLEFGVWWGQTLVAMENLRAVHEPYNHQRHIVGFDTFSGYPTIGDNDRRSAIISEGVYKVADGYETYLAELVDYHEKENVLGHFKKHSIVKGDAKKTCPDWMAQNPQEFVALAFFDMALYEPTKVCLEAIKPRLISGSVVAFDELNHRDYPGETKAALEVLGIDDYAIANSSILPDRVFFTKR